MEADSERHEDECEALTIAMYEAYGDDSEEEDDEDEEEDDDDSPSLSKANQSVAMAKPADKLLQLMATHKMGFLEVNQRASQKAMKGRGGRGGGRSRNSRRSPPKKAPKKTAKPAKKKKGFFGRVKSAVKKTVKATKKAVSLHLCYVVITN